MESQAFMPRDFSVSPVDLIPNDDFDDDQDPELTVRQFHHDSIAKTLDADDIQILVTERLSTSLRLRARIEEIKANPYRPNERRHMHVSDAAQLGDEIEDTIAEVIDELVEQIESGGAA